MNEETHRLLNQLLSGELSEAEFERLEQLMNESCEATAAKAGLDRGCGPVRISRSVFGCVVSGA